MGNKIKDISLEVYNNLKESGLFYELYPEASGNYRIDQGLSKRGKFKIEQE